MIETVYITDGESGKLTPEAGETLFGDLVHEVGAKGAGYDDRLHPLTVALLVADAAEQGPSPHPRVRVISSPLPGASSAGIRAALRDPVRRDDLAALPASSFRHLRVLSGLD